MDMVALICSMADASADIAKAIPELGGHSDAKRWDLVGYELGRIQELGKRIEATCRLARREMVRRS